MAQTKNLESIIRFRAPEELAARLTRIALRKQGTVRSASFVGREAVMQYVERAEREMDLEPITKKEVKQLLAEEAKSA